MPIELPLHWIWILNISGWPVIQLSLASLFLRLPDSWFRAPRTFAWEKSGRFYERGFGIKRWKDSLPDAAGWFGGGFAKRNLASSDTAYLERFIRETWRGELCHWSAMALAPVFFLWNPWWASLVMLTCALLLNLPCILAQRYNRARMQRLLLNKDARQIPRRSAA